jgi:hypothetical protein
MSQAITPIAAKVAIATPTPTPALAPADIPCGEADGVVEAEFVEYDSLLYHS